MRRRTRTAVLHATLLVALAFGAGGCGADEPSAHDKALVKAASARKLPKRLPASRGRVFHVATTGSDRAPGTSARPWRTVQKALDTLRPGQVAVVRPGVYRQNLVAQRAGTSRRPITIRGERGAILAAGRGEEDNMPLELFEGAAYLRFQGLVFEGATGPSTTNVYAASTVHDIELSRCEVRRSRRQGFFSEPDTRRVQILNCHFHDNGGGGRDGLDHNIYMEGSQHVVAGNLLTRARNGNGIQLYPSSDHVIIASNTIADNELDGILIGSNDERTSSGSLIVNNIITGSRAAIGQYWAGSVGRDNVARDNLGWRNEVGKFEGSGVAWGDNVRADPKFVDAAGGNFRLAADSPALDRALPSLAPPTDLDGRRRPSGSGADLGAFER
jgi:hypothetical protein